jgi:hypothetical protein
MAVTIDGTPTTSATAFNTNTITFSHTVSGSATGLFVGVGLDQDIRVSGVTWNGSAMTELWDLGSTGIVATAGYLMVSPAAATANVVVTLASTNTENSVAGAVSLAGIVTSSVAAAHRTVYTANDGAGGAPSVTVVDSQSGDLVIDSVSGYVGSAITVGTGQTSRCEDDDVAGNGRSFGVSTESAAGSNTVMSWTTPTIWVIGATALIAASGGSTSGGPAFDGRTFRSLTAGRVLG